MRGLGTHGGYSLRPARLKRHGKDRMQELEPGPLGGLLLRSLLRSLLLVRPGLCVFDSSPHIILYQESESESEFEDHEECGLLLDGGGQNRTRGTVARD